MTQSTPPGIERIATSLTAAQRSAIVDAHDDGLLGNHFIRGNRATKELHEHGLTTIVWSGLMLNATGEQVRAHLLEQQQCES